MTRSGKPFSLTSRHHSWGRPRIIRTSTQLNPKSLTTFSHTQDLSLTSRHHWWGRLRIILAARAARWGDPRRTAAAADWGCVSPRSSTDRSRARSRRHRWPGQWCRAGCETRRIWGCSIGQCCQGTKIIVQNLVTVVMRTVWNVLKHLMPLLYLCC